MLEFVLAHFVVGMMVIGLGLALPGWVLWWLLAYALFLVISVRELAAWHKARQAIRKAGGW